MAAGAMVVLFATAVASAHRPAIRAEARAMIYHASGRYYGNTRVAMPSSIPLRCFEADIATVVKGSQWGAFAFSRYAQQQSHWRQCHTGNGWVVAHKIDGRWYVYWEGSGGWPPTRPENAGSFTLQPVPRPVARDLAAGLR